MSSSILGRNRYREFNKHHNSENHLDTTQPKTAGSTLEQYESVLKKLGIKIEPCSRVAVVCPKQPKHSLVKRVTRRLGFGHS
jgi:aminopeptidase-like protein